MNQSGSPASKAWFLLFLDIDMQHNTPSSDSRLATRQLAEELRQSLNSNCGRLFVNARNLWEREFAGREPSDACVRVRISGYALESFRSSPNEYASFAA